MTLQEFAKYASKTHEERESLREREIEALDRAGLAKWNELQELHEIRRKRIIKRIRNEYY